MHYDLFKIPLRTHDEHIMNTYLAKRDPSLATELDVNSLTHILDLPTLQVPESFPLDGMHLFYQGVVARVLVKQLNDTFWKEGSLMNRSDHGKSQTQINREKQAAARKNKQWIEPDNDGMKIPDKIWVQ